MEEEGWERIKGETKQKYKESDRLRVEREVELSRLTESYRSSQSDRINKKKT